MSIYVVIFSSAGIRLWRKEWNQIRVEHGGIKIRNFIKLCACHERYERLSTTNFDKANALTLCNSFEHEVDAL